MGGGGGRREWNMPQHSNYAGMEYTCYLTYQFQNTILEAASKEW